MGSVWYIGLGWCSLEVKGFPLEMLTLSFLAQGGALVLL